MLLAQKRFKLMKASTVPSTNCISRKNNLGLRERDPFLLFDKKTKELVKMEDTPDEVLARKRAPTTILTPKSIINHKYGNKAVYKTEVIQASTQNVCPGLAIPQQGPSLFRCCLELPELSVTSELFARKKDAEQAAAKMAIEKLGVPSKSNNPTIHEAWNELVGRVSYLFSDEVGCLPFL
ncbi:hypothetical protein GIB67_015463 [Kingdonia uniflora]|uniref:dsRNA binding domain-containing protein n=1 Tax=Kingdonia uniflora TaxID=39325 RepID=A0A7J7LA23_9MAGN|nr:hypothetical protein GIB67_015463 [Kingdonia uniflora]